MHNKVAKLLIFIRDPYKHYINPVMPRKLNIACRRIIGKKEDILHLGNLNSSNAYVETNIKIHPGVWILDDQCNQYLMPSYDLKLEKISSLTLAYKGKSNKNVSLIPLINYRQTFLKINNEILSYIKLPRIQSNGELINFELAAKELVDNSVFVVLAIEEPITNNLAESVFVSNRIRILSNYKNPETTNSSTKKSEERGFAH